MKHVLKKSLFFSHLCAEAPVAQAQKGRIIFLRWFTVRQPCGHPTFEIIKNKRMKMYLLISIIFFLSLDVFSQKSVEVTVGVGATIIDIESLVEKDEVTGSYATDWGTLNAGISGQFFFTSKGNFGFGTELMYQYLYWYSVSVPYGSQTIYREYSVSTIRVTPILRYGVNNKFTFDIGPEFNFMDGLILGLLISSNYYIPVSDNIDIPIKVRFDIMNNIVMTLPISLNAGIRIKM